MSGRQLRSKTTVSPVPGSLPVSPHDRKAIKQGMAEAERQVRAFKQQLRMAGTHEAAAAERGGGGGGGGSSGSGGSGGKRKTAPAQEDAPPKQKQKQAKKGGEQKEEKEDVGSDEDYVEEQVGDEADDDDVEEEDEDDDEEDEAEAGGETKAEAGGETKSKKRGGSKKSGERKAFFLDAEDEGVRVSSVVGCGSPLFSETWVLALVLGSVGGAIQGCSTWRCERSRGVESTCYRIQSPSPYSLFSLFLLLYYLCCLF